MNMDNTGAIPVVSLDTSPLSSIEDGHLSGLDSNSAALLVRPGILNSDFEVATCYSLRIASP